MFTPCRRIHLNVMLLGVFGLLGWHGVVAGGSSGVGFDLTRAEIEKDLVTLESAELSVEAKEAGRANLHKALTYLEEREKLREKAEVHRTKASAAPILQRTLETRNLDEVLELPLGVTIDSTIEAIERRRAEVEADREALTLELASLTAEPTLREERRSAIANELVVAEKRIVELEAEIEAIQPQESELLTHAVTVSLQAELSFRRQEISTLGAERTSDVDTQAVLALQKKDAKKSLKETEAMLKRLDLLAQEKRESRARNDVDEARRVQREGGHPRIKELLAINTALAEEKARWVAFRPESEKVQRELDMLMAKSDFIKSRIKDIEAIGGSSRFLLADREGLPRPKDIRARVRDRQVELVEASRRSLDARDEADALVNLDKEIGEIDEKLVIDGTEDREPILEEALSVLKLRHKLLLEIVAECDALKVQLLHVNGIDIKIAKQLTEIQAFINEKILWIRSLSPIQSEELIQISQGFMWFFSPIQWENARNVLWGRSLDAPVSHFGGGLIFILAIFLKRPIRLRLRSLAERTKNFRTDKFEFTVRAIFWTLLIGGWFSLWIWLLSRAIHGTPDVFLESLSSGLAWGALAVLPLLMLHQVCRRDGLGEVHFRWKAATLKTLRRHSLALMFVAFPVHVITQVFHSHESSRVDEGFGRVVFILGMITLAAIVGSLLRPQGALLKDYFDQHTESWATRLRFVWISTAVCIPLVLALTSALGYHYSAVKLDRCMLATLSWVLGVLLFDAVLQRWLLVARRSLAIEQARKRRAATEGESESGVIINESEINVAALNAQAQKLISTLSVLAAIVGTYLIWVDVLPALKGLNRHPLWTMGEGESAIRVTLGDGLLASMSLGMTIYAAGKIPAVLEFAVLKNLPLKAGSRYAMVTIIKYAIGLVGLVISFGQIGITWSKVQWLAAAMTVGLGFGLQEIFANFVAGIILLFERPIRIGDIVTVGNVTGEVSRIQIRATTIVDWDRKELLVPNKEFVTSQIINWTLSDSTVRLTILVGVAYGTDTDDVQRILLEIAKANKSVLDEPAPKAFFRSFGESTLDFELRVFLSKPELIPKVRHDLHSKVHSEFKKMSIEIAFPQRDLHFRTTPTVEAPFAESVDPLRG